MNGMSVSRRVGMATMVWPTSVLLACLSLGSVWAADLADLKSKAASGDINSQVTLGIAYRDGKGVERDYAAAVALFRKAAEKNDPAGLDNLGWMSEHGLGMDNLPQAVKYYQAAADKGYPQAQWNLGRMYAGDYWGHLDIAEAARWYRRAAEGGQRDAQYQLGVACLQGTGVAADDGEAFRWFRQSAQQGHLEATLALGWMYAMGRGVAASEKEARTWFAKAARPGSHRAADALEWLDLRKKPPAAGHFVCLDVPHVCQGWNLCAAASASMATRFQGKTADQYELKKLSGSPLGEGTDWSDVISAAGKLGCRWELVTFPDDHAGFGQGEARMMAWLDGGHPILLDITPGPPETSTGHTVVVMGYDAAGERWILNNPAMGPPGIMICDRSTLEKRWHSRWYSRSSRGTARPIILTR